MITMDQFMNIENLRKQGNSIRDIARQTNVARNTVRKVLRDEHPLEIRRTNAGKPKTPRAQKIDPFKEHIQRRWEECSLSAIRLLEEIASMGYSGGVHSIRRYLKTIKATERIAKRATVRFETPPAKQAQADWGYVGKFTNSQGKLIPVYVFVIVLSYSRQLYVRFTTSMKIPALMDAHQRAFDFFQGIPQSILYDNMSQVRSNPGKLNESFSDFARHYGFQIKTHRPYRPRTKGKVERMVDYVKDNFLNGREFVGLDDINNRAMEWLALTANERIHGTTGRKPNELWEQEKDQLLSLDGARPYSIAERISRKVGFDSYVVFDRSRYSVPPEHIRKNVDIQAEGGIIRIYSGDLVIAEHEQSDIPGKAIVKPEHMEELWRMTIQQATRQGVPHCNVRMDVSVEHQPLSIYETITSPIQSSTSRSSNTHSCCSEVTT